VCHVSPIQPSSQNLPAAQTLSPADTTGWPSVGVRGFIKQAPYIPRIKIVSPLFHKFGALPHEKSAFGLFTNLPPLEVVSNFATRSPLGLCTFAQRTEVAILRSLRQIVHEASGGVVAHHQNK